MVQVRRRGHGKRSRQGLPRRHDFHVQIEQNWLGVFKNIFLSIVFYGILKWGAGQICTEGHFCTKSRFNTSVKK